MDAYEWAIERGNYEAAGLLDAVRGAGGWESYTLLPRMRVLALRVLCEQGRAKTDDALLARLFPYHEPTEDSARPLRGRTSRSDIPKEVFWHILAFWRSSQD